MMRVACSLLAGLALLAGCDAAEVVVFVSDAGAAGLKPSAGTGGNTGGSAGLAGGNEGGSMAGGGASGAGAAGVSGAGMAGDSGYTCASNDDCPGPGWLCSKPSCGYASGLCKPRPLDCDASHAPVCGCNGITFWNDCLREQHGEASSTIGNCGANAKSCKDSSECGAGGDCAKQVPNPESCGQPGRGVCYVTPPECMVVPESHWWFVCPPPNAPGGQPMPCLTTCQAVQTGLPFVTAPKDACP